jgi:hypothetical protein
MEMTAASLEDGAAPSMMAGIKEAFNTRYGSLMGWQEAMRKLKPTPRGAAQFSLAEIVWDTGARTTADAVDSLTQQLLLVPVATEAREALVDFLDDQLGTSSLEEARSYLEHPLRLAAHLVMSTPQYQLA